MGYSYNSKTSKFSRCFEWGDEKIIFYPPSGETHYLNSLASTAFDSMVLDGALKPNAGFEIRKLFERFDELGLIEFDHQSIL